MEALKKSTNHLSIFQVRLIYGAAMILIITTVVTSIILNQKGTLSKSLGHGMTGSTVLGLTGGIVTGLGSLIAAIVYGCRRSAPPSKKAKYEVQKRNDPVDGDIYKFIYKSSEAYLEWQVIKSQDLKKYFWLNARIQPEMHLLLNNNEFFLGVEETFIAIYYKDNQGKFDTQRMEGYHFRDLGVLEDWDQDGKLNTVFQSLITQVEQQHSIKFSGQVIPYGNIELCMSSDAARRERVEKSLELARRKEQAQK